MLFITEEVLLLHLKPSTSWQFFHQPGHQVPNICLSSSFLAQHLVVLTIFKLVVLAIPFRNIALPVAGSRTEGMIFGWTPAHVSQDIARHRQPSGSSTDVSSSSFRIWSPQCPTTFPAEFLMISSEFNLPCNLTRALKLTVRFTDTYSAISLWKHLHNFDHFFQNLRP